MNTRGCDIPAIRAFRSPSKVRLMLRWMFVTYPVVKEIRGSLLDIGCGDGVYLKAYRGSKIGIDINAHNVDFCQRMGLPVHLSSIEEFETDEKFDTILLAHVLEHLDKPQETLWKAYSYLKLGGRLIVVLPCLLCYLMSFNDLGGHKQFINEYYVDYVLGGQARCKKIKSSRFPPVPLPYVWQYQEKRLIYERVVK